MESAARPTDVFRLPGYLAFWTASTVSDFGSYVTALALQVLVVVTLKGTATDVGLLNASRWLPYLLLGLVVGILLIRASVFTVGLGNHPVSSRLNDALSIPDRSATSVRLNPHCTRC